MTEQYIKELEAKAAEQASQILSLEDEVREFRLHKLAKLNRKFASALFSNSYNSVEAAIVNNVNAIVKINDIFYPPLYYAVKYCNVSIVRLLLKHGADVNAKFDSRTALHEAAWSGEYQVLKELLKVPGIDINATDDNGDTPLHRSIWSDNRYICEELINAGANVSIRNRDGQTAAESAKRYGFHRLFQKFTYYVTENSHIM